MLYRIIHDGLAEKKTPAASMLVIVSDKKMEKIGKKRNTPNSMNINHCS